MVRYISAKKATSIQDLLNEIAPDFNSKLSALLKKASNPTWDLEEVRSKNAEESNLFYIYMPEDDTDHPIRSTVKIYYRGITDTDKEFYVDIEKTMAVSEFEKIQELIADGTLQYDTEDYGTAGKDEDGNIHMIFMNLDTAEEYWGYVKDWDNWVDAEGIKAKLDIQYNKTRVKKHYEVPVDQIDETIQDFVDKYIDGEAVDSEQPAETQPNEEEQTTEE